MEKRLQKKRAAKGPTKAQLARLVAKANRDRVKAEAGYQCYVRNTDKARANQSRELQAVEIQRNRAVALLTTVAPYLAKLLTDPLRLPTAPPDRMVRVLEEDPLVREYTAAQKFSMLSRRAKEVWLTHAEMYLRAKRPTQSWALCFRMESKTEGLNLGAQMTMADQLVSRSPTAFRLMFDELAGSIHEQIERTIFNR